MYIMIKKKNISLKNFHIWEFFVSLYQTKEVMKIIDSEKLEEFIKKHADASNAIEKWVEKIEAADWKNHNELKMIFFQPIMGNNRYVFNIRGNNYRIVGDRCFLCW